MTTAQNLQNYLAFSEPRMRIGILASPRIKLDHIFYRDYHYCFHGLTRWNKIYLIGNFHNTPIYSGQCFSLSNVRLGILQLAGQNRYTLYLSHKLKLLSYMRTLSEERYNKIIQELSSKFFLRNNVDIVYAFPQYSEYYCLVEITKKLGKRLVVEFWEDPICHTFCEYISTGMPLETALMERERGYDWLKKVAAIADRVIVPTNVLKKRITTLEIDEKKISIVPVCSHPLTPRGSSVQSLYNTGEKKIIFYLGSLSAYHDLESLLKAMNKIKSKEAILIVAGGWKKAFKKFEKYINELKMPVIYTGKINSMELEYYLSCANICVATYSFPYPSGFFPATLIRYMLAGKAIVATDLPEIREMFKGSKAGLLVQQNDANELALAIDFLLENYEYGIKMGTTAKKIAENNYLWKHHTKELLSIFDSLR